LSNMPKDTILNMKSDRQIVVLDGYTLNPGDLSWDKLKTAGVCTIYDRTAPEEVIERAQYANIILINKVILTKDIIQQCNNVQYIGVLATGYNNIDVEAAREQSVVVTNVPTYGTSSVAQMVFAHIFNLTQHVAQHSEAVGEGRWSECKDFCFWDYPLIELQGLKMGIIGMGRIGLATAKLAQALGMDVLFYDPMLDREPGMGKKATGIESVFSQSDVISLHCPLTKENYRLINSKTIALMKPTALVINTSRGDLIDEVALAEALNEGKIGGAGLDVLAKEPPAKDNPLLASRNCFITPHIAWATKAARQRLMDIVVDNITAFLQGRPINVVNP